MLIEPNLADRVALQKVAEADRKLIDGLSQFYIYDFSEMSPIVDAEFAFEEDGKYAPLPGLDDYWSEYGAHALVIRFDRRVAGFVLINTHSHRDGGMVAHNMGEFFVARQFRHSGIADEAVRQVLAHYPGHWEIAIVARNIVAKSFWPRAIAAAPNVTDLRCVEGDGDFWAGPIWCFSAV